MLRLIVDMKTPTTAYTKTYTGIYHITHIYREGLTSRVFTVAVVVFPLVFERQLVTQGRGERQQAGSTSTGGQRGLETCWVWREWDRDGVAMGKVLSLELLLLKHTQKY